MLLAGCTKIIDVSVLVSALRLCGVEYVRVVGFGGKLTMKQCSVRFVHITHGTIRITCGTYRIHDPLRCCSGSTSNRTMASAIRGG